MRLFSQYAHWENKQFHLSVRRPEIREDFRRTQFSLSRQKNREGFLTPCPEGSIPFGRFVCMHIVKRPHTAYG